MRGITERRGLLCLLGEPGTGKTPLLRELLEAPPPGVRPVMLLKPRIDFEELIEFLLRQLDRPAETGLAALRTALAAEADAGRSVVLLVDEAEALPSGTLAALPELVLPLTSSARSAVQVLLAGQPPLSTALAAAGLLDRIGVLAHLRPLARNEVAAYIHYQLARAGARRELFTPGAVTTVALLTRGVPRLVSVIADASLLMAFRAGARAVTEQHVRAAWKRSSLLRATPAPRALREESMALPPPTSRTRALHEPPRALPTRTAGPREHRPARALALSAGALAAALLLGIILARPPSWQRGGPSAATPALPQPEPAREPLPSAAEALDVVDAFRRAYEARDTEALERLLAVDAAARLAAVAPDVRALDRLAEVAYVQPAAEVEPRGPAVEVRAPFVIRYRDLEGHTGELRGTAVWQVARRDGAARIVGLARELAPGSALPDDRS